MIEFLKRTMVIERLSGVALYAFLVLLVYFLLRKAKDARRVNNVLDGYLVALCLMALLYVPEESTDVYRWLVITDHWADIPLGRFIKDICIESSTPTAYLMFYLCRLTRIDGMMSLVSAFLFYYHVFYIFKDLFVRRRVTNKSLATTFLFFMSMGRFLETISGLRCMVSLAILAKCFYDEIVNKKPIYKNLIWEVFAALYHLLGIMVLAVRIVFLLFEISDKGKSKKNNLIIVAVIGGLGLLFGGELIFAMIKKAISYLTNEKYSYFWEYMIATFVYMLMAWTLFECYRIKDGGQYLRQREQIRGEYWEVKSVAYHNWAIFNALFLLIEIAFCYQYSIFHRLGTFSTVLCLPLMAKAIDRGEERFVQAVEILSVAILLIACARGDLCAYKFFLIPW